MSHEIDMSNGRANVMVAGEAPWHRLGVNVDRAQTSDEAIGLAGLDWRVESWPVRAFDAETDRSIHVPNKVALVRDDTKAVVGVHSESYAPLQNRDAFGFMDSLVQDDVLRYETAGSLKGGKVIWMLAKLPGSIELAGGADVSHPYMLLSNSHDGTQAIRVMPTAVRVVCQNTLRMAHGRRGQRGLSIRHTGRIESKIAEAREVLGLAVKQTKAYGEQVSALAGKSLKRAEALAYFEGVVPIERGASERTKRAVDKTRGRLMELFMDEPANTLKGIEGTAWAALNAVTQYVDHEARAMGQGAMKDENRLRSSWFGQGDAMKSDAFEDALDLL
jgi:phage/plasmid-like protein (TIGR03299 family)